MCKPLRQHISIVLCEYEFDLHEKDYIEKNKSYTFPYTFLDGITCTEITNCLNEKRRRNNGTLKGIIKGWGEKIYIYQVAPELRRMYKAKRVKRVGKGIAGSPFRYRDNRRW